MSLRQILIGFLIFSTLVIPIVQLSFGFHYIDYQTLCPLQPDIMLLMAIGGFFEAIFFAICFGFLYKLIPTKYKEQKAKTAAQQSAQGSNRSSTILIGKSYLVEFVFFHQIKTIIYSGCITGILGACAIIFFILIQYRVYKNYSIAQWTDSTNLKTYCDFTIFSSAFGMMIATYVAFIFLFLVACIFLCGLCAPKR